MSTIPYVIRNYCPAEVERYLRFLAGAASICHSDDRFFSASLSGESPHPFDCSDLFVAEKQGNIVGSCRVVPELAIERVVLRLFLASDSAKGETGAGLVHAALKRAGTLGAARVHADLNEENEAGRKLFAGLGFKSIRRYTDMVLTIAPSLIVDSEVKDLSVRSLEPGEEVEFTRLQNRVFAGAWGFCPNTTSQIVQQLNTRGYGHAGVILAYHGAEAAGYSWTAEILPPEQQSDAKIGRIHMMGVAPEFRGQGFGSRILWAGVRHLARKGIEIVELTVDNENEAARSLYERAGFKPKNILLWYEKKITPDGGCES